MSARSASVVVRTLGLLVLSAVACLYAPVAPAAYVPAEDVVRQMNRGVGLMEQYRFTEAASEFEAVVRRAPQWPIAHVNLGIAYLNTVSDPGKSGGALDRAEKEFRRASELDQTLPNAHYCLGILSRYKGDSASALRHFERVLALDPHDADSLYFTGTIHLSRGDLQRAADYFRRAIAENAYLLSAHYSLAQALVRMQQRDAAMAALDTFQQLEAAKVGVRRAIVYTEMGAYADVVRMFPPAPDAPEPPPAAVRFVRADVGLGGAGGGTAALADVDGDGDLDLFLPNVQRAGSSAGQPALYENTGGRFARRPLPGAPPTAVAGIWGDYDNDGHADLYVLATGGNRLLRNDGAWKFTDVTGGAALPAAERRTAVAAWVDADHDGDLDLLLGGRDGLALYRNNGNGTFADLSSAVALAGPSADIAGLALGDFDTDGDVDILAATRNGAPQFLQNDRLNRWSVGTTGAGLRAESGNAAVLAADFDKDGDGDLLLLRGDPYPARFYQNGGDGAFVPYQWTQPLTGGAAAALDYDNDGDLDIFVPHGRWGGTGAPRPLLLANDGAGRFRDATRDVGLDATAFPDASAVVAADLDGDGDTDLLVCRDGAGPLILRNDGGNRNRWLHLTLQGVLANRSGYGAAVEVKAGSLWQRVELHMVGGVAAASNPRIEVGLGAAPTADFVRIVWPNAVLQSELEVAANQARAITEVQRKASSCPLLFAWNGMRFEFVTDFLGGGGLGFFIGADAYASGVGGVPDPTERVKIERHQVEPLDGEYLFQIMEPMEEVSYVDAVSLLVVDHPADTEVYPNERFATDGNPPDGRIFTFAGRRYPVTAFDHKGRDVLGALTSRDRVYPPVERHDRFLGYVREEHALLLDFGPATASLDPARPWVLGLYGWIEYPYSHVVYAAQQAGIETEPISVDVLREDGTWETVLPHVGYPAGMPKMMTLDLSGVLSPARSRLRLRTNLKIYVDEVFLAEDAGNGGLRVLSVSPHRATLQHKGYPREYSPDARMPRLYDYTSMDHTYAFRNMRGRHTRYGDVRELLLEPDDRYVLMGRGEELTVAFDAASLPPAPEGFARSLVLHTDGFCKDMDLYTAHPDTVEPLPFQAMSSYPYPPTEAYPDTKQTRAYRDLYQTREK
jgi:Tfp pilus assembly protein PilF